ncbi:MAG: DPP IV N-terminal domain-containing protein [Bacteroidetes bacterium]|nr:DPP IV N-terminal domain-containing protein [Bacteroidota bacterium]
MNISKISLFLMVCGSSVFAQTQKYTMAEAVNGLRTNLAVKNISQPSWIPGKNILVKFDNNAYLSTEVDTKKTDTVISLFQLNKNFAKEKSLKKLPVITFINDKNGYYKTDSTYFKIEKNGSDWKTSPWLNFPSKAENITVLEDANTLVYTLSNNLFANQNGKAIAITQDKNENILNGQAVHRNEFGIDKGIFISPDHKKIAFYRMDQSMVADYPVIDWSVVPAQNKNIKYPMAGKKSHEVTLGIYDLETGKTNFINTIGDKEQYLTSIAWTPDSQSVFIGILNRDQNNLDMNLYNATTGNLEKNLFTEKNPKYVHPTQPMLPIPKSQEDFIYQSEKSGYNHLYLFSLKKGIVKQITNGDWTVTSVLGIDPTGKNVYFVSTKETPLEKHLYKVNISSNKITRLDNEAGVHIGILSPNSEYLYDSFSNATTPRKINIINTQNGHIENILIADNPLTKFAQPEVKNITLKADDGTMLYGKLILPPNFNPNKKYPVIDYLYNGPNVQLITNSFPASGNLWYDYMAQNGYIVFSMDGRGSFNRGLNFENATFGKLGTVEMEDQLKGVDYLKSLPYVNAEKMGVHGWSFGGFMTTSLMLRHPGVFQVGVAGGPVIDWNMYEIMYTERYMDTPEKNPEGYKTANLLDKVQNLKGKLLLIHGAQDDVVVWQHSINFLKAAVDKGVQVDYFMYPGHQHNVTGKDRVHLMQKVTDYFDLYLKK